MWIYSCFDGDDDEVLKQAQHDLYWGTKLGPEQRFSYGSALWWWWNLVVNWAEGLRDEVPWFERNFARMKAVDGFSHKLLQTHHEHIAAYYRWTMRGESARVERERQPDEYRTACLEGWRRFFAAEVAVLMQDTEAHLTVAKIIVYRYFEASDTAADRLDEILMRRFGMACVVGTWRAGQPRLVAIEEARARQPEVAGPVMEVNA
jgi:hypothetical protein